MDYDDWLAIFAYQLYWWVHAICPESALSPVQLSSLDAPITAITDGRHWSSVIVEKSGWGEEEVQGKHTTTLYPMTIDPSSYCHRVMVQSSLISVPLIVYWYALTDPWEIDSAVLLFVMHSFVSFGWLKLGCLFYNVPKFYLQYDYKQ